VTAIFVTYWFSQLAKWWVNRTSKQASSRPSRPHPCPVADRIENYHISARRTSREWNTTGMSYLYGKPVTGAHYYSHIRHFVSFSLSTVTGVRYAGLHQKRDVPSVKAEDVKLKGIVTRVEAPSETCYPSMLRMKVIPRGRKGNTTEYGLNLTLDPFLHFSFSQSSSYDLTPTEQASSTPLP